MTSASRTRRNVPRLEFGGEALARGRRILEAASRREPQRPTQSGMGRPTWGASVR